MTESEHVQYVSEQKYEALRAELKTLKETTIPGIATRIDEAKQMGDLSENAEYHQAREDMSWAQGRAKELEYILEHAEIISGQGGEQEKGVVNVGSVVTVKVNGEKRTYTIVGAQEANPGSGSISNESPLGQAFMGKSAGDSVEVTVPAGKQTYKIVSVS